MLAISFNVNSIRSRIHQLEKVIEKYNPDVIGLQETKVQDKDFPVDDISSLGYHAEFLGQKTHYGVALLSKVPPVKVEKGMPDDDEKSQKRLISAEYKYGNESVYVINGYFPQGESRSHEIKFPAKEKFYKDITALLGIKLTKNKNIILMGDMNISPEDKDIGIGEDNAKRWLRTGKCSFLPEEREWLGRIKDLGMVDTFRKLNPEEDNLFSWFDYRSFGFQKDPKRGLRIDLIMTTENLANKCSETGIDYEIRGMTKPSDHCPIYATFDI